MNIPLREEMDKHARAAITCTDETQETYLLCLEEEEEYEGDFEAFYERRWCRIRDRWKESNNNRDKTHRVYIPRMEEFLEDPASFKEDVAFLDYILSHSDNQIDTTIFTLLWQGHTQGEVGVLTGLSQSSISKRLKRYHDKERGDA